MPAEAVVFAAKRAFKITNFPDAKKVWHALCRKKYFFVFGIPAGFVPGSTNNTFRDCKTRSELYPGLNYTFFFSPIVK